MRAIEEQARELAASAVDLRRGGEVSGLAVPMLDALQIELAATGCHVAIVDPDSELGHLVSSLDPVDPRGRVFIDRDTATQWFEDIVLDHYRPADEPACTSLAIEDHPALAALAPDDRSRLAKDLRCPPLPAARSSPSAAGPAPGYICGGARDRRARRRLLTGFARVEGHFRSIDRCV
ncbi:hypothetical protein ACQPXH_19480 [Nocardia sp. CA-135953]|uniref:hypothetical protein n=1 Tax=Nocardia sp. CA-135953 TaxID=3239978 RepID=UPI003D95DC0B